MAVNLFVDGNRMFAPYTDIPENLIFFDTTGPTKDIWRLCCTNPVRDSSRESSVVAGLHEQTHTPAYKTRNWPAYNEALRRRGSLTIWFDPEMSRDAAPTGGRGRQQTYSDTAIQTCLTMKGEGRPGNMPVACFSPERAEPRDGSAWRFGRSSHGNATGPSDHGEAALSRACCG